MKVVVAPDGQPAPFPGHGVGVHQHVVEFGQRLCGELAGPAHEHWLQSYVDRKPPELRGVMAKFGVGVQTKDE